MTLFSSIYTILNKKSFQENQSNENDKQQQQQETIITTTTTTTTIEANEVQPKVEEVENKPRRGRKKKIVAETNENEQPKMAKEMVKEEPKPQQQQQPERVLTRAQRAKLNKMINQKIK